MTSEPNPGPTPSASAASPRRCVKAWLIGYFLCYAVLFGLYFHTNATRGETITSDEWLRRVAVSNTLEGFSPDGERAAVLARLVESYHRYRITPPRPGTPMPGEVRFLESYAFITPDGSRREMSDGMRLTRSDVAGLAWALLGGSATESPALGEMRIYRDTFLTQLNWPYWLTLTNVAGFLLMIWLFLWGPIRGWLAGAGEKAEKALARARAAEAEAESIQKKYAELLEELEARRAQNEVSVAEDIQAEHDRILTSARAEAASLMSQMRAGMETELRQARERIKREVVASALGEARRILAGSVTAADHHAAVSSFIDEVEQAKL